MAIQMRRGSYANFDPTRLQDGEFAICLDNGYVFVSLGSGNVIRLGTAETIQQAVTMAQEYANQAQGYAGQAQAYSQTSQSKSLDSEAYGVGKRNGVDVGPSDPAYHNNAKYYANQSYIIQGNIEDIQDNIEEIVDNFEDKIPTATVVRPQVADYATITVHDQHGTTTANIYDGQTGPKGDKGDTGSAGPKGDKGDKGDTGADGSTPNITMTATVDSGSGTPDVEVTKGGTLENPTFALAFSNLKGTKGDTGDTGATGPKGDKGDTGDTGPKGDKGDKGNKGDTGATGRGVSSITMSGSGKTHPITATYTDGTSETVGTVRDGEDGQGSGDMTKAKYDPQNHGYVDAAGSVTDGTNSLTYAEIEAGIHGGGVSETLIKDTVGWIGKNLLPNYAVSKVDEGVTFVVSDDGSITANGTATSTARIDIVDQYKKFRPTAGTYIISKGFSQSGCTLGIDGYTANNTWVKTLVSSGGNKDDVTVTIDYSDYDHLRVYVDIDYNTTVTDRIIYPMLRRTDMVSTTYEPYHVNVGQTEASRALLGAKNSFNLNATTTVSRAQYSLTQTGIRVYRTTAQFGQSSVTLNNLRVLKNTDYILTCDIEQWYSGHASINIMRQSSGTLASGDVWENKIILKFNSGDTEFIKAEFICADSNETGDVTYSNIMLRLTTDPDGTYAPYAMTNKELTDSVTKKTLALSVPEGQTSKIELQNIHSYKIGEIGSFRTQVHVISALAMNDIILKANVSYSNYDGAVLVNTNDGTGIYGVMISNNNGKLTVSAKSAIPAGWYALNYMWIID